MIPSATASSRMRDKIRWQLLRVEGPFVSEREARNVRTEAGVISLSGI
jgi:hypothetical protein